MNRMGVIFGFSEYRDLPQLDFVANDVKTIRKSLGSAGFVVADHHVHFNDAACSGDVAKNISDAIATAQDDQVVLIYFSGHGFWQTTDYVVCLPNYPVDAAGLSKGSWCVSRLSLEHLFNMCRHRLKLIVIIFDACGTAPDEEVADDVHIGASKASSVPRRPPASIYFLHAAGFDEIASASPRGVSYLTEALDETLDPTHPAACLKEVLDAIRDIFVRDGVDQMPRRVWAGLEDDDSLGRLPIFDTSSGGPRPAPTPAPLLMPGSVQMVLATPTDASKISSAAMRRCWSAIRREIATRMGKKPGSGI